MTSPTSSSPMATITVAAPSWRHPFGHRVKLDVAGQAAAPFTRLPVGAFAAPTGQAVAGPHLSDAARAQDRIDVDTIVTARFALALTAMLDKEWSQTHGRDNWSAQRRLATLDAAIDQELRGKSAHRPLSQDERVALRGYAEAFRRVAAHDFLRGPQLGLRGRVDDLLQGTAVAREISTHARLRAEHEHRTVERLVHSHQPDIVRVVRGRDGSSRHRVSADELDGLVRQNLKARVVHLSEGARVTAGHVDALVAERRRSFQAAKAHVDFVRARAAGAAG